MEEKRLWPSVVLLGFVIGHLLGNLQIFLGQNAINAYALKLRHLGALLWSVRLFLIAAVILHMVVALQLARENKAARPARYRYQDTVQATYASRSMVLSGVFLAAFIVYHLLHFTFRVTHPAISHLRDPLGRDDVYSMMVLSFQNAWISIAYVAAMGCLCFHLGHGAASWCQSLGLADERSMPAWKRFADSLSLAIFVGYVSIPIAVILNVVKLP